MRWHGCKRTPSVANERVRLQGVFYHKKEELHRRAYRSEREFLKCVDEYIIYYNSQRSHRNNNYKSPDGTEKIFEESMLSEDLS